jgi:hypothetical protein
MFAHKNKIILYILGGLLILVIGFLLLRSTQTQTSQPSSGFFGFGGNVSTTQTNGAGQNIPQTGSQSLQKVFKIADGPIAGAAYIQMFSPTTTLARYVLATNGHVLDLAVDVPGAAARPVSNTTIPGVVSAIWGKNGSSTVLQYVDTGTLKTVYIGFASTSANGATGPARIQFLPNNIISLALSPDTKSIVYLLKTTAGVDGYIANTDGTNSKKLFSLPLSQVLISWPAQGNLLAQTKGAVGVPGVAFSVNAKTGAVIPLLYTSGLTASANSVFSKIIYQTSTDAVTATTYAHDIVTGKDTPLVSNPLPEKCIWSIASLSAVFCALSLDNTPIHYLDMWHQGLAQTADSIVEINTNNGVGTVITLPGDGGVKAPIERLGVSPDGNYLLFITRGDRSLWGVRLR